ncbi:Hypothetical protein NTJ_03422 [Nesidiocoris tenuis]|uniref:Uncharacterized protein n=1 Tax=Nesidiocoris tenuis TaxID=355587 RepID=A0ABN7AIC2_9HEMI|nr:Hypothetical protein NTJ_03422 [Nesidiocoris tenuis]
MSSLLKLASVASIIGSNIVELCVFIRNASITNPLCFKPLGFTSVHAKAKPFNKMDSLVAMNCFKPWVSALAHARIQLDRHFFVIHG